jgi:N6-L-threonylcarbamoyladenine synthase
MKTVILGIESSCDDTAAAVCIDGKICSNVVSSQLKHADFGGVIPELASRLHQVAIGAVVEKALADAAVLPDELTAIVFTAGPGLMGSLLVGTTFAKAYALALGLPLVQVNHLDGHRISLLLAEPAPTYPLVCLTVSGGHTQLEWMESPLESRLLGSTRDDAAGEAFDKAAKLMGLPYPGGPALDKLAETGDASFHPFPKPQMAGLDFSFSGLKTSLLYYLQAQRAADPTFLDTHRADLCASFRQVVVENLLDKLFDAAAQKGVTTVGIAGGVSANGLLRRRFAEMCTEKGLHGAIPPFAYCTDNAAMIALSGHYQYLAGDRASQYTAPYATSRHTN